jgi:hypothetical protein
MRDERSVGVSDSLGIMESVEAIKHPRENLEAAVRATLSGVQDHIAEAGSRCGRSTWLERGVPLNAIFHRMMTVG